jgi:hypothetical protein
MQTSSLCSLLFVAKLHPSHSCNIHIESWRAIEGVPTYPNTTPPAITNHHTSSSRSFNIENISHYLRLIMFGAYDDPTKHVLTSVASGTSAFQNQANVRDQLTANNLFDTYLLVVSMSRAVEKMAPIFTFFLFKMLDGQHGLQDMGQDAKPLYTNISTFLLTGQLLERAKTMGINPDLDTFPSYIGFHEEDVKIYGYFLRFVTNLPLYYADATWDPNNADYRMCYPPRRKERNY